MILRVIAAVDPVNPTVHSIKQIWGEGCTIFVHPLKDATVIDHAGDTSYGVGATTEAEHPDLVLWSVMLSNVLVYVDAVSIDVMGSSTVEDVL